MAPISTPQIPFGRVLTAMVTPFTADGALDLDGAQRLATHLVEGYADFQNLAGAPDKIKTLLDGWAQETNDILKANDHFGG